MYNKTTFLIILISVMILFYLANNFNAVNDLKFTQPKDLIPYYESAANQFLKFGFIICFLILIWVDVVIIKTKQLFWLWLPFLFVVVVAVTIGYHQDYLFQFRKANNFWDGGFSLSYFLSAFIIFITGFILLINYIAFKHYFKNKIEINLKSNN